MRIDISDIAADFPDFCVAVVVAGGLSIPETRPASLHDLIGEREADVMRRWAGMELSAIPGIAAWRRAYRAFGIRKTSYRSSVERLVKNALAGRPLPPINGFVDSYNAVSLSHVLPLGADDLDKVVGDVAFRYSRPGDTFLDMASGQETNDPPKPGEVVYSDAAKVLCRRWNWRQDQRSLVSPGTRRAIVTVQANGWGDLDAAVTDLVHLIEVSCGGRATVTRASATQPSVDLRMP
ncbi:B3/B4 domain-containing protein [Microbaculum marinum]|uniref:Phenylalanine--tRNA ligase beta subunit-related protein n=1 Tax=Microbaculum marinum TaxID=1764581 RepID=A0AAW9RV39_9HYPH